jgi:exosortase
VIETLSPTPSEFQPVAASVDETPASRPDQPSPQKRSFGFLSPWYVAPAIVAVVLGWSYAPNLRNLVAIWNQDPNYSHGFLVIPVALVIAWRRWAEAESPPITPSWWGWLALVGVLAVRAVCYERGAEWTETATLLPVIACLALAACGWPLLGRIWPAIGFLVFLLPLPQGINSILAQPLQHLATLGSCALMKLTGLWVVAEGNVILVGGDQLEVAAACNGLSMLMCLAATVAAMTVLVAMARWKRVVLFLSIIPIALISNIFRISATGWCYHLFGADVGGHFAHDAAGWLMMPVALALVGLELGLLAWLVIEVEELPAGRPDRLLRRHPI